MSDQLNIFARLAAPFPPERVSWRVGSTTADKTRGMALAYVDARDVMQRLDEVVGPDNWQRRYVPMHNGTTCCEVAIRFEDGTWVWKSDGAGATDYEAEKGAYSDAFKRAAVNWGIARYLYDLDSPWVEVEAKGRSVLIKQAELPRLQALLRGEKPKSNYQARKDGDDKAYQRVEKALRAAARHGMKAVAAVWKEEQEAIKRWPDGWQQSIAAEKDRIKAELEEAAAAA